MQNLHARRELQVLKHFCCITRDEHDGQIRPALARRICKLTPIHPGQTHIGYK